MKKRLISLLLIGLLLISLLPATVLAEGDTQLPQTIYTSEECQATAPDAEKSSEKLFDGFVQRQLGKRAPQETAKVSGAGEKFKDQMAVAYQAVFSGIHQVAIGQRASTIFEVKFSDVGSGEPDLNPKS